MQAGQFSRTQGLRRKLKEPRSAGQSSAASLCSQCTTSDDDSNRVSFMSYVCHITHVHATKFKMKKRTNPRIPVLFCVSRQKLGSIIVVFSAYQRSESLRKSFREPGIRVKGRSSFTL